MHIDPKEGHPAMDYTEHQRTYRLFLKLTVYTIVGADLADVAGRQRGAYTQACVPLPEGS